MIALENPPANPQNYAINVHKSGTDLKTYIACGNVGAGGGSETDNGTTPGYGY